MEEGRGKVMWCPCIGTSERPPVDWGRRDTGRNREKEKDISMRAFCFRNRKKSSR